MDHNSKVLSKMLIGWQEWCALPEFDIAYIKAKIDTGAKTSSLHAFNIKEFRKNNQKYVSFEIHPIQDDNDIVIKAKAKVIDQRNVMSSNGHKELRYVITTDLILGSAIIPIELTLSNRDPLRFRMLLGRDALSISSVIDPAKKNCLGKKSRRAVWSFYKKKISG